MVFAFYDTGIIALKCKFSSHKTKQLKPINMIGESISLHLIFMARRNEIFLVSCSCAQNLTVVHFIKQWINYCTSSDYKRNLEEALYKIVDLHNVKILNK